jgi:hypothetical protein
MSIKIKLVNAIGGGSFYAPTLYCDECLGEINQDQPGHILYLNTGGDVFMVHKQCGRKFEAENGGRAQWLWLTLTGFLMSALVNTEKLSDEKSLAIHELFVDGIFIDRYVSFSGTRKRYKKDAS